MTQVCKKCKTEKSFEDFGKSLKHISGYLYTCKSCLKDYNLAKTKKYQKRNYSSYIKQRRLNRFGRENNILILNRDFSADSWQCASCKQIKPKEDFGATKYHCFDCRKKQYNIKMSSEEFRDKERTRLRTYQRVSRKDPKKCLDRRISNGIWYALRGNKAGRRWESLVGYTLEDLFNHIESKFELGMSWQGLIDGKIHIDHKTPKSWFLFSSADDAEFKQCWSLDNLQPKWAVDNLRKSNKFADL